MQDVISQSSEDVEQQISELSGNSEYSSYSKKQKFEKSYAKDSEYMCGFLSGVFFNIFAVSILYFINSKDFKEGVYVGWIYFIIFIILIFLTNYLKAHSNGSFFQLIRYNSNFIYQNFQLSNNLINNQYGIS